jgi:hypothetical protein
MNKKLFPWIITLAALSVSGSAAFYSVYGLGKMFAGASVQVMILASSLEFSKLVTASLLYRYWTELNKALRTYLSIATLILILVTSAGIYGFLSSAYQETANKAGVIEQKVSSLEEKKKLYIETRDSYLKEKLSITKSKDELSSGLSKSAISQRTDKKGNVITTANNSSIKTFSRQLEATNKADSIISAKLSITNDSIFALDSKILDTKTNSGVADELGPLKYISNLTGKSLDSVVNWYIIVLMLVFDPLAIALVIAANFAFEKAKERKEEEEEEETIKEEIKEIIKEEILETVNIEEEKLDEIIEEIIEEHKEELGTVDFSDTNELIDEIIEIIETTEDNNTEYEKDSDKYNKDRDYGGYKIKNNIPIQRTEDPTRLL